MEWLNVQQLCSEVSPWALVRRPASSASRHREGVYKKADFKDSSPTRAKSGLEWQIRYSSTADVRVVRDKFIFTDRQAKANLRSWNVRLSSSPVDWINFYPYIFVGHYRGHIESFCHIPNMQDDWAKIASCGKRTKLQTSFGFDVELRLDVGFATVPILLLGEGKRAFFMSVCLHLWSSESTSSGEFHKHALEHGRLTSDHFCDGQKWVEHLLFQPHHWLRSTIHCNKIYLYPRRVVSKRKIPTKLRDRLWGRSLLTDELLGTRQSEAMVWSEQPWEHGRHKRTNGGGDDCRNIKNNCHDLVEIF